MIGAYSIVVVFVHVHTKIMTITTDTVSVRDLRRFTTHEDQRTGGKEEEEEGEMDCDIEDNFERDRSRLQLCSYRGVVDGRRRRRPAAASSPISIALVSL